MKSLARCGVLAALLVAAGVAFAAPAVHTMNVGFHNYVDHDGSYHLFLMTPDGKPVGEVQDGDRWGLSLGRSHLTNTSLLSATFSVEEGVVTLLSIEGTLAKDLTLSGPNRAHRTLKAGEKVRFMDVKPDDDDESGASDMLYVDTEDHFKGRVQARNVTLPAEKLAKPFQVARTGKLPARSELADVDAIADSVGVSGKLGKIGGR